MKREGLTVIVSALTPAAIEELGLEPACNLCHLNGLGFLSFPIEDRYVPRSRAGFRQFLEILEQIIARGARVGVHCRACIGRSSVIAAGILIRQGFLAAAAFDAIAKARGSVVPDTKEQRLWTEDFLALDPREGE